MIASVARRARAWFCPAPLRRVVEHTRTRDHEAMVFRWEVDVSLPRETVWRFVANTDSVNRLAGLFDVRYEYEPRPEGGSVTRAAARKLGIPLTWTEKPAEWVESEWFRFDRHYDRGPIRHLSSEVRLSQTEDGTRIVQTVRVVPVAWWARPLAHFTIGWEARRGFTCAYSMIEAWAARGEREAPRNGPPRPLGGADQLRARLQALSAPAGAVPHIADRLTEHLLSSPATELGQLHPYRLADRWGFDRSELLRLFLHGTQAGMFDMSWGILCPACRRASERVAALAEVAGEAHCDTCNIQFSVELDRLVEVTFSPGPLGLGVDKRDYCHFGPRNTPHRLWVARIPAGERVRRRFYVAEAGAYRLRCPQTGVTATQCTPDSGRRRAEVIVTPDGLQGLPAQLTAGELELSIINQSGVDDIVVTFERAAWADDAVTAADVLTMGDFHRLFGRALLNPGASYSVRNLTFLFSDLVGSTQLYEERGDAPAFALVRDHFEILEDIYARRGGTLVKTIGDSIMAVFRRSDDAVLAALEMQRRIGSTGMQLRIGIHTGPCIAMEANGGLDYFGHTVNVAARTERAARGGQVAFTQNVQDAPGVPEVLDALAIAQRYQRVRLKGLAASTELWTLEPAAE